jgi:hypothetical protein
MKLYKYFGPEVSELVFPPNEMTINLKCAFPKEYNDPYELFLSIDPKNIDREVIAYYCEIIGDVPQVPVTCFAKSPSIIPMWAHYGQNHRGFVIELDELGLMQCLSKSKVADVQYSASRTLVDLDEVNYAYVTKKPRHTFRVQQRAFQSAYFTKHQCWSYECERRLVLDPTNLKEMGETLILEVAPKYITAIISGARADDALKNKCANLSTKYSCPHFEMRIGRCSGEPFFVKRNSHPYLFLDGGLTESYAECVSCGEPLDDEGTDWCHWCALDHVMLENAAWSNPLRLLAQFGLLENYVEGMGNQGKNTK